MHINDAQQDFRRAYVDGGPGLLVSGLVWLAVASTAQSQGIGRGFAVLFIGGMLIHPVSTVLCRTLFGRTKEATGNPLVPNSISIWLVDIRIVLSLDLPRDVLGPDPHRLFRGILQPLTDLA